MKQIRWDHILEDEAHLWASNCSGFNSPHSRRRENRTHVVKELVFVLTGCHAYTEANWDKAFHEWSSGNKTAPLTMVSNYTYSAQRKDAERAFSLLNWADTDLIGCGFANLETLSATPVHKQYIVCSFAEGGNQLGKPVYTTGEPASKCPSGFSKSSDFKNLCNNHTTVVVPTNPWMHVNITTQNNNTVETNCTGFPFSAADQKALVDQLNSERTKIATGAYAGLKNATLNRPNGFPKAGNMRAIVWDAKLATHAIEAASHCTASSLTAKDKLKVSEILFAQSSANAFPEVPQWKTATAYWISRKDSINGNWISKFDFGTTVSDREASTYAQIIWADSWEIGCAFANYGQKWTSKITSKVTRDLHIQYIICHFANPGDVKGLPIYVAADPCSKCATGETCTAAEGLCHKKA